MEGIEPFKNASDLENLHKSGARTGASDGRLSHIKSDVRMEWDGELGLSYSEEYSFVGGNGFFSFPAIPARLSLLAIGHGSGCFLEEQPSGKCLVKL